MKKTFENYNFWKIVVRPGTTYFAWEQEDAAGIHIFVLSLVDVREKATFDPNCQAGDFLIRTVWSCLRHILSRYIAVKIVTR